MSSHIRVSLLMNPWIAVHSKTYAAGTERVFFQDSEVLKKNKMLGKAYARTSGVDGITALWYPQQFFRMLPRWLQFIFELGYALFFVVCERNADRYISYTFPHLALFAPKKTVVMLHSLPDTLYGQFLYKRRVRDLTVVCCSYFLQEQLVSTYPWISGAKLLVLYNAVDTKKFRPVVVKKNHQDTQIIRLLFASAWVPEKGLLLVLKALSMLSKRLQQKIHLTIASDEKLWHMDNPAENTPYVASVHAALKKFPNHTLLGGQSYDSMPAIYSTHDFLLFPSQWDEPFGLVILEALACGAKVIAFDRGAVREIVSEKNSYLSEDESAEGLNSLIMVVLKTRLPKTERQSLLTSKNSQMNLEYKNKTFIDFLLKLPSKN